MYTPQRNSLLLVSNNCLRCYQVTTSYLCNGVCHSRFYVVLDAVNLCELGRGRCGPDVLTYEKFTQPGTASHTSKQKFTQPGTASHTSNPSQHSSLPPTSHTLLVKGVPADTPDDFINLYFENSKLTGHYSEVLSCQKSGGWSIIELQESSWLVNNHSILEIKKKN